MRNYLKKIRAGGYARIIQYDKHGNIFMRQLRWNEDSHKFFICDDKRGLQRQTIGKREAVELLTKTLYLSQTL